MKTIHSKSIEERIEWLFELAHRHSEIFKSPESCLARERYLAKHPTSITVLKCMDGRINIPVATNTPAGILMPFRNLGGMFDLGWPHLGEVLAHHVHRMVSSGRRVLILITYHWSKGDPARGCAGFKYNTEAAISHTKQIESQVEHIFGTGHETVYPLVCGFETDEESLIIHGVDNNVLDLASFNNDDVHLLDQQLTSVLPDMPEQMRIDLLPLLKGNIEHIAEIRDKVHRQKRSLDVEHREWMICLGRGFDFLHTPNIALIIGPYSPDLADPILKAANIIKDNMRSGRIPSDGFLLLASVPYDEIGVDRARAELKSRFLSDFGEAVICSGHPDLAEKMTICRAVLDWRSRTIEQINS